MKPEFYRKVLGNGLVVLFEKRQLPVVAVSSSVRYGAAYETEKVKGVSHFIEHLMFKGSKTRSQEEIAREIEKKGGILNGYTSEEITSFWCKLRSKFLDIGGEICSDLILNPRFDVKEFEKEKRVIIEEIRMYKDNPRLYVIDKIKELLYEKPFGMSVAGTEDSVRGLSRNNVMGLHNSVYAPNQMIFAVIGKSDIEAVLELAKKLFPKKEARVEFRMPVKKNEERVEKRKGIDQANFVLAFHVPDVRSKKRYDVEILNSILAGGMSSRLFQEIREKRGLAYAVKGDIDIGVGYGYYGIYVGTTKEKLKEVKEIILRELKKIRDLKNRDLEEAKEQLIGLNEVEREDSVRAMTELVQEEIWGKAEEYYKYADRINAVRLEDVKKLAKIKSYSAIALIPE